MAVQPWFVSDLVGNPKTGFLATQLIYIFQHTSPIYLMLTNAQLRDLLSNSASFVGKLYADKSHTLYTCDLNLLYNLPQKSKLLLNKSLLE